MMRHYRPTDCNWFVEDAGNFLTFSIRYNYNCWCSKTTILRQQLQLLCTRNLYYKQIYATSQVGAHQCPLVVISTFFQRHRGARPGGGNLQGSVRKRLSVGFLARKVSPQELNWSKISLNILLTITKLSNWKRNLYQVKAESTEKFSSSAPHASVSMGDPYEASGTFFPGGKRHFTRLFVYDLWDKR